MRSFIFKLSIKKLFYGLIQKRRNIAFVLTLQTLTTACSINVVPWERGNLAKEHMTIHPQPSRSALRSHVFNSKEASQGGTGSAGGGCGCN